MEITSTQETPRTLLSLVTLRLRELITALPTELVDRPEHEVINQIRKEHPTWIPSEIDFGIRLNFWKEYTWAQKHNIQMRLPDIYRNVCSENYFFNLIKDEKRLAYILCEFPDDAQKRKVGLSLLWNEIVKIINMPVPINLKTGVPEPKIMSLKVDLFKFLYAYEHGQAPQTINQTTKNLNYNIDATPPAPESMEDIDEKIRQLEAKTIDQLPGEPLLPVERVVQEAGRVTEEFKR